MLSLATVILSPSSFEISSSAGAIIRPGPHHSAQKSTRTGPSAPSTSDEKLWSVTVLVAMASALLARLTAIWAFPCPRSRHEFDEFRARRVEQRSPDRAAGEDHRESLRIGHHVRAMRGLYRLGAVRHAAGLEVDYQHALVLDQETVDRPGD